MKASGIFDWPRGERVSDRYGMIGLTISDYGKTVTETVKLDRAGLEGLRRQRVHITARVLAARDSGHIGDMFRGIFPSRPEVGEVVDLGEGKLMVGDVDGWLVFGLVPDDGRDSDWFDPRKLYRLHDQTVELDIEVVAEGTKQ
jgi:hypothetical protein